MAGLLVSFSGIIVICLGIFSVLPGSNQTIEYVFIGIGWLFVIIGMIIRFQGMKIERQIKKATSRKNSEK